MSNAVKVENRQHSAKIDLRLLKKIALHAITSEIETAHYELAIHLVGKTEMSRINQQFLNHTGSTDVITFDYSIEQYQSLLTSTAAESHLCGELYICVDDAMKQANEFRSTFTEELVRYVVHGLLHLKGYDDRTPAKRRRMKREENRVVSNLAERFDLSMLAKLPKLAT